MDEKIVGKCIKCGGDVIEKEKYYVCKNRKATKDEENGKWSVEGCDFIVFKDTFKRFGKNKLTVSEMKNFLKDKEVVIELTSKAGNKYKKFARFDEKWNIAIDFNTRVEEKSEEKPVKEKTTEEENTAETADDTLTFNVPSK